MGVRPSVRERARGHARSAAGREGGAHLMRGVAVDLTQPLEVPPEVVVPPPLDRDDSSLGFVDAGQSSSRPASLRSERRRSFGSLATRFSLRSPSTPCSPSHKVLSANILDSQGSQPTQQGLAALATTPSAAPVPSAYCAAGSTSRDSCQAFEQRMLEGMSLPSGPQSEVGGGSVPGGSDAFVRLSRRLHCVSRHARTALARCAPCMNAAKKHDRGVPGTRQHV